MSFLGRRRSAGQDERRAWRIRPRFTYANVAATLALVFAMSGGALAAGRFIITSTGQIKPSVLKQLHGKAGVAGKEGPAGKEGAPGKEGPAGKPGANGANGSSGANGVGVTSAAASAAECKAGGTTFTSASGASHVCNGENGQTGYTATLPHGKTEMGAWSVQTHGEALGVGSISFGIPLENALGAQNVVFLEPGQENEHCPGTLASPEAEAGYLCVYEQSASGGLAPPANGAIKDPSVSLFQPGGAARSGASVVLKMPEETAPTETGTAYGTWAVTAE